MIMKEHKGKVRKMEEHSKKGMHSKVEKEQHEDKAKKMSSKKSKGGLASHKSHVAKFK
jgi:hypothetical protein